MDYDAASAGLVKAGWRKEQARDRIAVDDEVVDPCTLGNQWLSCTAYPEMEGCGHVCDMYYRDGANRRLRVFTTVPRARNGAIRVRGWDIETAHPSSQQDRRTRASR